jgi:STE24 endopeptidase
MTILVGISLATSIPFSWYYTFVIEERHGFNKQTAKLWIMDQIKTYILMAVIGLPFLAGFLKVVEKAGRGFVPWLMLFVCVHPILLNKRIQCCGIDGGGAKWDWVELFLRWRTSQIFPERSLLTASVAFQLLMQIIYPTFSTSTSRPPAHIVPTLLPNLLD